MKRDFSYIAGIAVCAALGVAALMPAKAIADDYTFNFNTQYSPGATAPTGPAPWITVEIKDVALNTVDISINTAGLQDTEKVMLLALNLNPALNPTSLSFGPPTQTGSFTTPTISLGANDFMMDGGGDFDIQFAFSNPPSQAFVEGDALSYQVTAPSLDADDFDYLSTMSGGNGTWLASAHITSIGSNGNGSGWDAPTVLTPVPEPAPAALLLLSTGLWFGIRRLRNRAAKA